MRPGEEAFARQRSEFEEMMAEQRNDSARLIKEAISNVRTETQPTPPLPERTLKRTLKRHRPNPGHSIAAARALKSGLLATAGGRGRGWAATTQRAVCGAAQLVLSRALRKQ